MRCLVCDDERADDCVICFCCKLLVPFGVLTVNVFHISD
jgi:hypothetical protein